MDLKRYLPGKDEDKNMEYLWALIIEPNFIQAGIWRISDKTAQIICSSNPVMWENHEDLVSSADTALSAAINEFPEDLDEPNKTVFGVISSWVSEGQIKEEYLDKIKQICEELSLKPAGFVILAEALAHYLKTEEGSPLNSILIGVYEDKLEISLFKLGNLVGVTLVARSVSLVEDVVEGLTRFEGSGAFPSRFVLYDGKDKQIEEVQQQLINVNWDDHKTVKFLHPPKIEIVNADKKLDAISFAGAAEMGEVQKVERVKLVGNNTKKYSDVVSGSRLDQIVATNEDSETDELASPEDLGFATGAEADNFIEIDPNNEINKQDIKTKMKINYPDQNDEIKNTRPVDMEELEVSSQTTDQGQKRSKLKNPFAGLSFSLAGLIKPFKIVGRLFRLDSHLKKVFIFGILSLVILFCLGFAAWWYLPKATVTIYLSPQRQNERIDVYVVSEGVEVTDDKISLPGQIVSATVSDNRTISTTGTAKVGERASGEVMLYRVGTEVKLQSGTEIRGSGNLRFNLNDDIVVASGSAGTPGTAIAKITAQDIGSEYNLASGSTFTVGNFSDSDIEAKNESDFSGGTSREVSAVSERDMANLEDELSDELTQSAITQMREELRAGQTLIDESIKEVIENKSFSASIGDQADTLKLSMTKTVRMYTVDQSRLIDIAKEVLMDKISEGYALRDENIDVEFTLAQETEGVFKYDTRITANLLPQADSDEIKENIKGKHPVLAYDYINKIPGFVRADIKITPTLPGRLNTLPKVVDNIKIELAAER